MSQFLITSPISPASTRAAVSSPVQVLVQCDLGAFSIAAKVSFAQLSCQICLRFSHGTVDRSVVVIAFISFAIAAEIDPDEPSAAAS